MKINTYTILTIKYKQKTYDYYILNLYTHYNTNKIIMDSLNIFLYNYMTPKKPTLSIIFGQNDYIYKCKLNYSIFIHILFDNIKTYHYDKFHYLTQYFTNILKYKYIIDLDNCTLNYFDYDKNNFFNISFTLLYFRFYDWYNNIEQTIQDINILKYNDIIDSDNDF